MTINRTTSKRFLDFSRAWRNALLAGLILPAFILLTPATVLAQDAVKAPKSDRARLHLVLITQQSIRLQRELAGLQKKPATKKTSERMLELQNQLDVLDQNFEAAATRLQQDELLFDEAAEPNLIEEVKELGRPLLQAIRDLTEKPRKIDKLKRFITALQTKLSLNEEASKHLAELIELEKTKPPSKDPVAAKYLSYLKTLKNKYDPELARFKLEEARRQLDKELATDETLVESAVTKLQVFFKTRGRNLLVTVATFAGLWWLFLRLRKWLVGRKSLIRMSTGLNKVLNAVYNLLVLIICLSASLICLYLFNDWLLISLVIIGLFAMAWASRQWIPGFLQELKLMVNLGTVREGERLIWKGVPWLVKDIGLSVTLFNERLDGGKIKIPVKTLIGMHSRPVVKNEPWFPTKPKNWVMLSDDTYGQVKYQTIEQVVLRLYGGSLKYYATPDFLSMNPVNFSDGFCYCIEFRLDYSVQSKVCEQIPALFQEQLRKLLHHHLVGTSPHFTSLKVMFDHAGASSLKLVVLIDVDGSCAHLKGSNQREIQAALVKICNENNLVIPFEKLTVSLAEDLKKAATTTGFLKDKPGD